MNWSDIILNILISITASFFFWLMTFKISFTKVIFAHSLIKSENSVTDAKELYGYKVRFANVGFRDLIEATMVVRMVITVDERSHVFFLEIMDSEKNNFIAFLPGMITNKIKKKSNIRTITFYPSKYMIHELAKGKYSKKIRNLAKSGKIQFNDLFEEYGENITITIYVYGNDRTTGARKMFESQQYTINDIEEGDFFGAREITLSLFSRTKVKRALISQVHKKDCTQNSLI